MLEMFTYCNYVPSVHLRCVSVFGKDSTQFGMRKQTQQYEPKMYDPFVCILTMSQEFWTALL